MAATLCELFGKVKVLVVVAGPETAKKPLLVPPLPGTRLPELYSWSGRNFQIGKTQTQLYMKLGATPEPSAMADYSSRYAASSMASIRCAACARNLDRV